MSGLEGYQLTKRDAGSFQNKTMDLKPYNVKSVLNNVEKVLKNQDINLLSKTSYHFLYLMSGFIAHYDLAGFQHSYSDLRNLIGDIERALPSEKDVAVRDVEDPKNNGYGKPYCVSKLEIVEGLKPIIEKYRVEIFQEFKEREKTEIKSEIAGLEKRLATI